jgi:hypothetical protein
MCAIMTIPLISLYIASCYLNRQYIDLPMWRLIIHLYILSRLGYNFYDWFLNNTEKASIISDIFIKHLTFFRNDELNSLIPMLR